MRRTVRWLVAGLLVALSFVCAGSDLSAAGDDFNTTPSQWPNSGALAPSLQGWPNALRIAGNNRYETSTAAALVLRGAGEYPYNSPDPSSGGAASLSEASGWWGLDSCPSAVIIAAGDSPADAVVAATLSDPTNKSSEPYLQRFASSDPLFLPIGGFGKVDTNRAPLLLTQSQRVGASGLSTATRFALNDLTNGGCSSARQAIIVGGPQTVPVAVETELISEGFSEVFRVSGGNRYGTATAVARSMSFGDSPQDLSPCGVQTTVGSTTSQTFRSNGVVEWRPSRNACQILPKTVVVADGVAAADALAAGWWTSFWQVPVVLHDGSDRLPTETSDYLATTEIENIFVLGGESRIGSEVRDEIKALTGANVRRVAGPNRYATSVAMAKHFGGWWPTGRGLDFAGSTLCVASSSAFNSGLLGWADALVAGPLCAVASAGAAEVSPPNRALSPVNGASPGVINADGQDGNRVVPIILVAPQRNDLPPSVAEFLSEVYAPADRWCSSLWDSSCVEPGFALVFGGSVAVSDRVLGTISSGVAGRSGSVTLPIPVQLDQAYITKLSMGFVAYETGEGPDRVCFERGSYDGGRWLSVRPEFVATPIAQVDAMSKGWYLRDADGVARSPGSGAPACLLFDPQINTDIKVSTTGISGQTRSFVTNVTNANRLLMTGSVVTTNPVFAGGTPLEDSSDNGTLTTRTFVSDNPQSSLLYRAVGLPVDYASITIDLYRNNPASEAVSHRFEASWFMSTTNGPIEGSSSGEARFASETWWLVGKSTVSSGGLTDQPGLGGFSAALIPNDLRTEDDVLSWRLDAAFD